jgi:hypothetical protein
MVDNIRSLRPAREPWDPAVHAALPGVRFVTPEQYLAGAPQVVRPSMVNYTVIAALAQAADADGVLLDFDLPQFYRTHVATVLSQDLDEDQETPQLVYDTFTAMALMDCLHTLLLADGLLANRGNADSADYRLTLPAGV